MLNNVFEDADGKKYIVVGFDLVRAIISKTDVTLHTYQIPDKEVRTEVGKYMKYLWPDKKIKESDEDTKIKESDEDTKEIGA